MRTCTCMQKDSSLVELLLTCVISIFLETPPPPYAAEDCSTFNIDSPGQSTYSGSV